MKTQWPPMHASGDEKVDRLNQLIEANGLERRFYYYGRHAGEHTWWLHSLTPIGMKTVLKYLAESGVDVTEFEGTE